MTTNTLTKKDRKAIYARDGYRCALCDSTKYIQIHHYISKGAGGTNHPHNLITLCADCHALAHGVIDLGVKIFLGHLQICLYKITKF